MSISQRKVLVYFCKSFILNLDYVPIALGKGVLYLVSELTTVIPEYSCTKLRLVEII